MHSVRSVFTERPEIKLPVALRPDGHCAVRVYYAVCDVGYYSGDVRHAVLDVPRHVRVCRENQRSYGYLAAVGRELQRVRQQFDLADGYLVVSSTLGGNKFQHFFAGNAEFILGAIGCERYGTLRQPRGLHLHPDISGGFRGAYHSEKSAGKKPARGSFVLVVIGAVAVVQSEEPSRAIYRDVHTVACVGAECSIFVVRGYLNVDKVAAVGMQRGFVRYCFQLHGVAEGTRCILRDDVSVFIVRHCTQLALVIGNNVVRCQLLTVPVVDVERSLGFSVQEKLYPRRIGTNSDIYRLTLVEIPVRENMNERSLLIVRPLCAENVRAVFRESRGVVLTEIGILRAVRGRLSDVVESTPDELTRAEFRVPVLYNALLGVLRAPAGAAISDRGALLVIVREYGLREREVIYAAALNHRGSLAAVDRPVGVSLVVLVVEPLAVIVARQLQNIGALLTVLPLHVIRAKGNISVALRVVELHQPP